MHLGLHGDDGVDGVTAAVTASRHAAGRAGDSTDTDTANIFSWLTTALWSRRGFP